MESNFCRRLAPFRACPHFYPVQPGEVKSKMSTFKTFYLGILAGVYIAFGSCLAMTVGGACQVRDGPRPPDPSHTR
jgi:formate/nitrite transporter FocA (FNT family)